MAAALVALALSACSAEKAAVSAAPTPTPSSPFLEAVMAGARARAQDRQAQATARNALVAAMVHWVDNETYVAAPAALEAIEPSIRFRAGGASSAPDVAAYRASRDDVTIAVRSESGRCFVLRRAVDAVTYAQAASGRCAPGRFGPAAFGPGW